MLKMNDLDSLYEFLQGRDVNIHYGPFHLMGVRLSINQWNYPKYSLQSEYNDNFDFQLSSDDINGFYFKPTCIGHDLIIVVNVKDSIELYNIKIW